MEQLSLVLADAFTIARRNIIRIRRVPELAVGALVQPLVMILMFVYVFGGSIAVPGVAYREFLIGGIFALILTFGSTFTGAGLAQDMQAGVINRFRVLPMSRSAVVLGRVASDVVLNGLSLVVMAITGFLVGWRIHDGIANAAIAFGLLLLFAFALSWIMAYIGLILFGNSPEGTPEPSAWPMQNAELYTLAWIVVIIAVFAPLAIRRYRSAHLGRRG